VIFKGPPLRHVSFSTALIAVDRVERARGGSWSRSPRGFFVSILSRPHLSRVTVANWQQSVVINASRLPL